MHTGFSPDSGTDLEDFVARCVKTGLDCIAVTDHNTIQGALKVQAMAPFRVIIGEEIKSAGGEIIGLFLKEVVPRGLPALETVKLIKEQGGLVSIPHPFDHFRRSVISREALYEVLPYVDIVEAFNARNTLQGDNRKAEESGPGARHPHLSRQRLPHANRDGAHVRGDAGIRQHAGGLYAIPERGRSCAAPDNAPHSFSHHLHQEPEEARPPLAQAVGSAAP